MLYIFPVATAHAAEGASGGANIMSFVPIFALAAIFYFFMIRPQQKNAKIRKEMIEKLKKGDNVLMRGGIYGKIISVNDDVVMVEVAENVRLKVDKDSVSVRKTS